LTRQAGWMTSQAGFRFRSFSGLHGDQYHRLEWIFCATWLSYDSYYWINNWLYL